MNSLLLNATSSNLLYRHVHTLTGFICFMRTGVHVASSHPPRHGIVVLVGLVQGSGRHSLKSVYYATMMVAQKVSFRHGTKYIASFS